MARMYFNFKTNLKPTEEDICTPQVDYIAFENAEAGLHISVGCNWESDYEITSGYGSAHYSARFKGYMFLVILPTLFLFVYEIYAIVMEVKKDVKEEMNKEE